MPWRWHNGGFGQWFPQRSPMQGLVAPAAPFSLQYNEPPTPTRHAPHKLYACGPGPGGGGGSDASLAAALELSLAVEAGLCRWHIVATAVVLALDPQLGAPSSSARSGPPACMLHSFFLCRPMGISIPLSAVPTCRLLRNQGRGLLRLPRRTTTLYDRPLCPRNKDRRLQNRRFLIFLIS